MKDIAINEQPIWKRKNYAIRDNGLGREVIQTQMIDKPS